MASPKYFLFVSILCEIILLLLISNLPNIVSQDSSPTIAQCTAKLIPLIPCTPFMEGTYPYPGLECCGNLKQLYIREPHCVCLFLTHTNSLHMNRTLVLQLAALCTLQVNANSSACLGEQVHMPAISPHSQVSFPTNNKSTTVASHASPGPQREGRIGFLDSEATKIENKFVVVTIIEISLFAAVFYY